MSTVPPPTVLAVRDAEKCFGPTPALRGVSLEVRKGEMIALLGPNGAGKTTLIRSIAGRVRLDAGRVEMFGSVVAGADHRPDLGVVPQEIALYGWLTAAENLRAFGELSGLRGTLLRERVAWALDWTALAEHGARLVKQFSGGMKRRLNLACGVLHRPRLVLLDEPTVGVDPQSRERIHEMLAGLRRDGLTIVLTTHHLEEAEAHCERIVIIDHGRVIAAGTLAELVTATIGHRREVDFHVRTLPATALDGFQLDSARGILRTSVDSAAASLAGLIARVEAAGVTIEDVTVRKPSLQSVFLHLTGKELRE